MVVACLSEFSNQLDLYLQPRVLIRPHHFLAKGPEPQDATVIINSIYLNQNKFWKYLMYRYRQKLLRRHDIFSMYKWQKQKKKKESWLWRLCNRLNSRFQAAITTKKKKTPWHVKLLLNNLFRHPNISVDRNIILTSNTKSKLHKFWA